MSYRIIETDSYIIRDAVKEFSPTRKLKPLDILEMISSSKEKLVERFLRDKEVTDSQFLSILRRVLPRHLKAGSIKQSLERGSSSKSFFIFERKEYGNVVILPKIGKQICEAFRSDVDLVILRPKPSGLSYGVMPEVLIRKKDRKTMYNNLVNSVSGHILEAILSVGPWQYDDPRNGKDTVTHIISKHAVQVSLLTRIKRGKEKSRPVKYFSKVLQVRTLQRFPKIREGFEGLTCEILVDNKRVDNELVRKVRGKVEVFEANDMMPGKWYEYGMNFKGKYPIIQHGKHHFMCIDYFFGLDGTAITFCSDSALIRDSLHIVIAHFDRARSIYSFSKYPDIDSVLVYHHGIEKCSDYIHVEDNREGEVIRLDLTPNYRKSVEWNAQVNTVSKQSRINHEFIFIKYRIDKNNVPMTTQSVSNNRCCNLEGLNCYDCMKAVGLIEE